MGVIPETVPYHSQQNRRDCRRKEVPGQSLKIQMGGALSAEGQGLRCGHRNAGQTAARCATLPGNQNLGGTPLGGEASSSGVAMSCFVRRGRSTQFLSRGGRFFLP